MVFFVSGITSKAAEEITENMVLQISEDTAIYEKPDENSNTTGTFNSGTPVIVREDAKNGWCKVSYQDTEGYVRTSGLKKIGDLKQIAAEFDAISDNMQLIFDSIVLREQEERRTRIWGVVIVTLVIAIFGVGIISSIKSGKENNEK